MLWSLVVLVYAVKPGLGLCCEACWSWSVLWSLVVLVYAVKSLVVLVYAVKPTGLGLCCEESGGLGLCCEESGGLGLCCEAWWSWSVLWRVWWSWSVLWNLLVLVYAVKPAGLGLCREAWWSWSMLWSLMVLVCAVGVVCGQCCEKLGDIGCKSSATFQHTMCFWWEFGVFKTSWHWKLVSSLICFWIKE